MRKIEIYVLAILFASFVAIGFAIDAKSFASNALASAADVIVSVFIAFYLVDRISRRERLRKWQKVRILMYRAVETTCDSLMFEFRTAPGALLIDGLATNKGEAAGAEKQQYEQFLDLGDEILRKIDKLSRMVPIVVDPTLTINGLSGSASVLRDGVLRVSDKDAAEQRSQQMLHEISSETLIRAVEPQFEKLSLSIFPRILELDENEKLISSFMEVEAAYRDWSSNVDMIEGDWGMPEKFAWEAAAMFCVKVGTMLNIIYMEEQKAVPDFNRTRGRR